MVSQQLVEIILKARDEASNTAQKVENNIKNIGSASSRLSKIPGFDTLRTKISDVATAVDGKLGGALSRARERFSNFGGTLSNVGSTIKGRFTGAVDGLRARMQNLRSTTQAMGGALGFLKGAASMTVGMIGYDLANSIMTSTRASLNARSSIQAFGSRLQMSGQEVSTFQKSLDDLQGTFKKVDMDVVGQQAMDMAYRLGLPKESLTQLTETSAIFTDAMQRNGRSAEDATLALADAMDGEFKRLKEIGISQEDLMKNGWSGDINDKTGLLNAMNKALKEQHYDELAKSVDTLDDAWQVLSITLGNLLESVLLPITPAIVGVITGITDMINGFKDAWNGLPDFAQIGLGIGIVAGAIAVIAAVIWAVYVPAWWAAATATWAAIAPILPIVLAVAAAVALLVAAVYEVGKAFGWWSDIGGMFDAISAGLQRLWDAFINHPDVQAIGEALSSAWQTISSAIGWAWQQLMQFLGIATGGEFDVVATIIQIIGTAWQILTMHIRIAIEVVTTIISLFTQLSTGQLDLWAVFTSVWNGIVTFFTTIFSTIGMAVANLAGQLFTWAIQSGLNFLTGIATYLSQAPARVATYLALVLARIISYGVRWVTQARAKASQLVNGVISFLRQLPSRALSALIGVVSAIVSAGAQWISNARNKASQVVTAVYNKMAEIPGKISSALSGVVSAITKPFTDAYNSVKGVVDNIISKASEVANISLPAFGGDAWGGDIVPDARGGDFTATYISESGSDSVDVSGDINLNLSLKDVPAHIDTDALIRMLKDKNVIRALVENRDFQSIDSMVKSRINYKVNRSRGV